jgi:hypothetical protein
VESAESDAEGGAPSDEELRRQKTTAQLDRLDLTPRSLVLLLLYIFFTLAFALFCLLLAAIGILIGLISLQPFPFLHPISRLAYALLAFWWLGGFLYFWIGLLPHGRIARFLTAARPDFPDKFRYLAWKRTANVWAILILVPYLIVLAFMPALLIKWWPMLLGPAFAVSLINTLLFVVLTQALLAVSWLPGQWLRSLERRT